jgi:hypothetical protein
LPAATVVPVPRRKARVRQFESSRFFRNQRRYETVNAELIGGSYDFAVKAADSMRKSMDAQRIAVDAVVALTDCDREAVTAFIRRLYLAGVKDPKRLTFKGLQALSRA